MSRRSRQYAKHDESLVDENEPETPHTAEDDEDEPDIPQHRDAGALLAKDRAGPIREKYPTTDGAANFSSMAERARDAVAYAKAAPEEK